MVNPAAERHSASAWAKAMLDRADWCILDCETTGFDGLAEIIQLAVLDPSGTPLLDTLVRPRGKIRPESTAVHRLTDEHVADAPYFVSIYPRLVEAIEEREVIIYNATFDQRMIQQNVRLAGLGAGLAIPRTHCAMVEYSRWVGELHTHQKSFRWQKLPEIQNLTMHSALTDCWATLALIQVMAGIA